MIIEKKIKNLQTKNIIKIAHPQISEICTYYINRQIFFYFHKIFTFLNVIELKNFKNKKKHLFAYSDATFLKISGWRTNILTLYFSNLAPNFLCV